jgi:hypothetical protein
MDKVGGGSIGPALGPGRGKDKHNYPGPQEEEKTVSITEHVKGSQDMKKL